MAELASAAGEYFAWRHHHPREAEDMSAVWGAAWRAGGRAALRDSAHLVDMAPLLHSLLVLLEDGRVEDLVRASDRRPAYAEDDDECEVTW
jgi:hypothetical protein